ncbi:MAG: hypothetical protein JW749_11070 [Sedimentisphaerales bacterium]|nr:hypothetical protein [Sedimentisphaerales bacterium]
MMNIYEQPWLLLIVAGVVLLGMTVFKPKGGKWRLLAVTAVIVLAAFGMDYFVKTDTEKIKAAIHQIAEAAQNEDVEAIGRLIANDYRDSLNDSKQELLTRLNFRLDEPIIEKNVPRIISLEVNSPGAKAVFTIRVVFDPQGPVYDFQKQMIFKLDADLVKQNNAWYFSKIELVELDMNPMDWGHIQTAFSEAFD